LQHKSIFLILTYQISILMSISRYSLSISYRNRKWSSKHH